MASRGMIRLPVPREGKGSDGEGREVPREGKGMGSGSEGREWKSLCSGTSYFMHLYMVWP